MKKNFLLLSGLVVGSFMSLSSCETVDDIPLTTTTTTTEETTVTRTPLSPVPLSSTVETRTVQTY